MAGADDEKKRIEDQFARYVISPEFDMEPRSDDLGDGDRLRRAKIADEGPGRFKVIIETDWNFPGGRDKARIRIDELLRQVRGDDSARSKPLDCSQLHVFAVLSRDEMNWLVKLDRETSGGKPAIYKIWPDHKLEAFLDRSVRQIKADACHRTFQALGEGVVWAVIDSGIDKRHPHFATHANLDLRDNVRDVGEGSWHRDFTGAAKQNALSDVYGHGTHVAGILGGCSPCVAKDGVIPAVKIVKERNEQGEVRARRQRLAKPVSGVAPMVKLVSLKVLDDEGEGDESALIAALEHVAKINGDRARPRIHGVNISLGYPFLYPEWFATGHSPVCQQVNRLVDQGVVVVVAAGNDGSAFIGTEGARRRVGVDQSIADPGNAEKAITVGSTHPEEPYRYGVSYFSSKGPTADGRLKPDLLAPGERILSCASAESFDRLLQEEVDAGGVAIAATDACYRQDTGTSMAAPHVSGAIAAFLSVRSELQGEPEQIKDVLMDSASDLGRKRDFQGAGMIDLMRAMQAQMLKRKDRRS